MAKEAELPECQRYSLGPGTLRSFGPGDIGEGEPIFLTVVSNHDIITIQEHLVNEGKNEPPHHDVREDSQTQWNQQRGSGNLSGDDAG